MKINQQLVFQTLLFFLALSIYLFKGGLYLFPLLIFISFIFYKDKKYLSVAEKKIIYCAVCVFLVGLLTTLIADFSIENIQFYLKKLSFILFLPVLIVLLKTRKNKRNAIYGLLIGLISSLIYSLYLFINSDFKGINITPFWDIGRWRELLTYSILFMIPFIFFVRRREQKLLAILLTLSVFISFLANGRATFLVLIVTTPCYIIIFQRKVLLKFVVFATLAISTLFLFPNHVSNTLIQRIESISNTTTMPSNLGRLTMWNEGLKYFKYNLQKSTEKALFGVGDHQYEELFTKYLTQTGKLDKVLIKSAGEFSFNDHHNAYLNTLNKQGLIFFIGFYGLLLYMFKHSFQLALTGDPLAQSSLLVISAYLIIGMFYSNQNGFQPTMFIFFWAVSFTVPNKIRALDV